MTLKRITFLPSALLFIGVYLLLICGLVVPAAAHTQRARKAKSTVTATSYSVVLRGRASWYGREHQGMRTSSGERFNRFKFTCAHKTLPFGTRLRVTNTKTGKAVVVRVSDRGPFRHQRIIDLAEVAARPLGIISQGAADVVAQIVPATTPLGPAATPANLLAIQAADPNPAAAFATYELPSAADSALVAATLATGTAAQPAPTLAATSAAPDTLPGSPLLVVRPAARFLVQAGAFADAQNAHALRERLLALDPALPVELREELVEGQALTRVLIGQLDSWLAAETVRRRLQAQRIASLVRQLPAQPVVAAAVAGPPVAP